MAGKDGSGSRKRNNPVKKRRSTTAPPRIFFLGGELHKRLHVDRGNDLVKCWNYPDKKTCFHSWSETRRLMRPAYRTGEVVKLINRSRVSIENAILRGDIHEPPRTYQLDGKFTPGRFMWSEDHVMEARDFFATQHLGFKRNDGMVTTKAIPTKVELRAMMSHGITTYVRTDDGEFVPLYKEIVW